MKQLSCVLALVCITSLLFVNTASAAESSTGTMVREVGSEPTSLILTTFAVLVFLVMLIGCLPKKWLMGVLCLCLIGWTIPVNATITVATTGSPSSSTNGGYTILTYTGNGTFQVVGGTLAVDVLVVGGGGAGGSFGGGAGYDLPSIIWLTGCGPNIRRINHEHHHQTTGNSPRHHPATVCVAGCKRGSDGDTSHAGIEKHAGHAPGVCGNSRQDERSVFRGDQLPQRHDARHAQHLPCWKGVA